MAPIITRLNQLSHLTPDQISEQLSHKGWLATPDITPDKWSIWRMERTPLVIGHWSRHEDAQWRLDGTNYYGDSWSYSRLQTDLRIYYFKPREDWTGDDDKPPKRLESPVS